MTQAGNSQRRVPRRAWVTYLCCPQTDCITERIEDIQEVSSSYLHKVDAVRYHVILEVDEEEVLCRAVDRRHVERQLFESQVVTQLCVDGLCRHDTPLIPVWPAGAVIEQLLDLGRYLTLQAADD